MDNEANQLPIDPGRMCLWMMRYPQRQKLPLVAVLLATLAGSALRVLAPWPMKLIVDNVIGAQPLQAGAQRWLALIPHADSRQGLLGWCIVATVLIFLAGWAVGLAGAYAGLVFGQRMVYDMAGELFGHLQRLSLRFHGTRSLGDLIHRVTNDCGCVATIVRDALLPLASALLTLASMFWIMWRLSPQLALLALAVVPLMMCAFRVYARPMLQRGYEQQTAEGDLYDIVERTLSAMPVVQSFCGEGRACAALRDGSQVALRAALATTRVQISFKIAIGLATALGTAGIIGVGSRQVLAGALTTGGLLVFLAYLAALYAPLHALMYTSSTIHGAAGSAWRVIEIFRIDRELAEAPHARPLQQPRGELRFENVTFGYEPDRPTLRGVDLCVPAGSSVAVVGASGAGKSTLACLVTRFFDPWTGRVTLDGADLRELKLASLREQVAIMLQDAFLFPMTLAQNIGYGNPRATRAQIESAARAAGADDFIRRLPDGYETVVGERGATLSGGERQRIAIARALIKDAPVLILDEPTASLDAATEANLLDALRTLMRGRTTLLIAHRLSTVRDADQIVVLEDGRIIERGSHDELIEKNGAYARLWHLQDQQPGAPLRKGGDCD